MKSYLLISALVCFYCMKINANTTSCWPTLTTQNTANRLFQINNSKLTLYNLNLLGNLVDVFDPATPQNDTTTLFFNTCDDKADNNCLASMQFHHKDYGYHEYRLFMTMQTTKQKTFKNGRSLYLGKLNIKKAFDYYTDFSSGPEYQTFEVACIRSSPAQ